MGNLFLFGALITWIFLDAFNIKAICLSLKLSYCCLRLFVVEYQVGPLAYHLKLPYAMKKLHLVFNVVKLFVALNNPILEQRSEPPLLPIIVNREKEQKIEKILDNYQHWRRFQFLVKQKEYSREYNSQKIVSNILALDLVVEFHHKYSTASRYIYQMDFDTIFKSGIITSRYSNLEEEVSIREPYQCYPWSNSMPN